MIKNIKIGLISAIDFDEIQKLIKKIYSKTHFDKINYNLYHNLSEVLFQHDVSYLEKYSIKIVYRKKIIGVMLLSECPVSWFLIKNETNTKYEDKKCLKSDFSGIDIKYQKKGLYTEMIKYIKENYKEFDFLWGIQHKYMSNLDFFIKKRIVLESDMQMNEAIYTIQNLK